MAKHILFKEPNYELLEAVARELGVELTLETPFKEAQQMFEQGIIPPGAENGRTPKEIAYLTQILPVVQERRVLPRELHIYMNDRGFANFPETFSTMVRREREKAFDELMEGLNQLNQLAGRERER